MEIAGQDDLFLGCFLVMATGNSTTRHEQGEDIVLKVNRIRITIAGVATSRCKGCIIHPFGNEGDLAVRKFRPILRHGLEAGEVPDGPHQLPGLCDECNIIIVVEVQSASRGGSAMAYDAVILQDRLSYPRISNIGGIAGDGIHRGRVVGPIGVGHVIG